MKLVNNVIVKNNQIVKLKNVSREVHIKMKVEEEETIMKKITIIKKITKQDGCAQIVIGSIFHSLILVNNAKLNDNQIVKLNKLRKKTIKIKINKNKEKKTFNKLITYLASRKRGERSEERRDVVGVSAGGGGDRLVIATGQSRAALAGLIAECARES